MKITAETPILYANPASGFSYKPALAMGLMLLPYELRVVDIKRPRGERSAEFREVATFGEVPVLLVDGLAISQSNVILEYLARRESRLHEGDESQRIRVREWLSWEANRIGLNLAHARAARNSDYQYDPAVRTWYDNRTRADLDHLDAVLAKRNFLLGDLVTIADVACTGYMYWADQAEIAIARWPNVQAWLARIAALPGYKSPEAVFAGHAARY